MIKAIKTTYRSPLTTHQKEFFDILGMDGAGKPLRVVAYYIVMGEDGKPAHPKTLRYCGKQFRPLELSVVVQDALR